MWNSAWKQEMPADAILVSDAYNMRYLSGFRGGDGYLFLTPQRSVLMTDSRYTTQAKEEAADFEVLEVGGAKGYGETLAKLVLEMDVKSLLFEDEHLIYGEVMRLQQKCPKLVWIPAKDFLNRMRCVKTKEECKLLEQAEKIGDTAFARILEDLKPGVTELQIAAKLDYYMKEAGASGNSFDTIVASGVHSAMPHAIPTEKRIETGDLVTMDFGCVYQGYCSDMTRTVVVGKASEKQKEIYHVVLEAQNAALRVIQAGKRCSEVDETARKRIERAGYGAYFGHGLGHGVGLFIHEEPRLSPKCQDILKEGMIETVEPGIYLPGFGGVRIEDMVCVTADGCRNFTHSPKELLEL